MSIIIRSENLEVSILPPQPKPASERFDSSCFVDKVILNGKHSFCVPEQKLPDRKTCNGAGLCAEFKWCELACEVKAGEFFPKIGVGLLRQTEDNRIYNIWNNYEVVPFELKAEASSDRVRFIQEPKECLGVAARIYREAIVWKNTLSLYTTIENTGVRALDLSEYHHNFVAIDDIPVGPGYRLKVPFDGRISELSDSCRVRCEDKAVPGRIAPGILSADGDTILWNGMMTGLEYHKNTQAEHILPMARYYWTLTHDRSPAAVSEIMSFTPNKFALWGIEHCICPEVFIKLFVMPGAKQSWTRTWIFEDDR